jgi:hypothetical protein
MGEKNIIHRGGVCVILNYKIIKIKKNEFNDQVS